MPMEPRLLTINSFDIQGHYGIHADCKTASLIGCNIASVMTCFNSPHLDVFQHHSPVSAEFFKEQLTLIFQTQQIDAIKIGLIPSVKFMQTLEDFLLSLPSFPPIVLDPVFLVDGNEAKVDSAAYIAAYKRHFLHLVDLIIPSVQEAEQLIGAPIDSFESARYAAMMLQTMGTKSVLLKGAQMPSPESVDFYIEDDEYYEFPFTKIGKKPNDFSVSLSTAITCYVATGMTLHDAVVGGRDFIGSHLKDAHEADEMAL